MKTGMYFRVERDGKHDAIELSAMTDDEIKDHVVNDHTQVWITNLIQTLALKVAEGDGLMQKYHDLQVDLNEQREMYNKLDNEYDTYTENADQNFINRDEKINGLNDQLKLSSDALSQTIDEVRRLEDQLKITRKATIKANSKMLLISYNLGEAKQRYYDVKLELDQANERIEYLEGVIKKKKKSHVSD